MEDRNFLSSVIGWSPVTDVAGEVVEVGPGVHSFKPGDKVVSMLNFRVIVLRTLHLRLMKASYVSEGASLPFAALEALRYGGTKFDGTGQPRNVFIDHGCLRWGWVFRNEVLDYKTQEGKSLSSPSGRKYVRYGDTLGISWSTFEPKPGSSWGGDGFDSYSVDLV
ncbi:hypothetical protein B296_00018406 [Ensete ventricosum]|uniref:Alcohol dehydrogenase-like N-terminal domain-containing protein n=1 Tax=Ensete ventricosum TaxID=4639 RepID=A0A427AYI2_ENSVE|nr:hypothetical protein B296_00018406 [Ensete ventricosum]